MRRATRATARLAGRDGWRVAEAALDAAHAKPALLMQRATRAAARLAGRDGWRVAEAALDELLLTIHY